MLYMSNATSHISRSTHWLSSSTRTRPPQDFSLDLATKLDQTAEFDCGALWAVARSSHAKPLPQFIIVNCRQKDTSLYQIHIDI